LAKGKGMKDVTPRKADPDLIEYVDNPSDID
jgi:hypothetical protein